jgi:uncharacterized protein YbjT (DUF2867 family)
VAVKALTTPGHEGKIYELTGPELLSYAEVVQKVAAGTGKPLRFVDVPEATWRQEMLSAGAALRRWCVAPSLGFVVRRSP